MSFGTFAFSPPMEDPSSTSSSSSRSTSVHQQEVARLKTPTAAHPYYRPGGPPSPLSYSPFAMSPHQFDSNGSGPTLNELDGFGELVGSAFGSNGILEQGNPLTAFGSLPAFDQTNILAHRSSFDPPSSASSFASTDRPGTAGGAATLINMSRSGAVYGEPGGGYPDEGSVMVAGGGIYPDQGGSRFGGGSFGAGGGAAFNSGGVDESRRSSPYDGTNSPSSNGSISHHPHPLQQPYPSYLRQYNNNRYPTPPDGISPAQTQPSFADLPPSSSSTATGPPLPLFYNTQNDPYANPNASRRASESHLVQQMSHSFYNQNPAAFHSPSNTPPLTTPAAQGQPHQYSTPSSTSSAHIVNPNLRVQVPARRPSTSSAARRPSSSSHAQSFDSSQQQHFVGRPQQQQSSRMQQQPHHPYAMTKRRESMGVVPSSTSSQGYWDQGGGGTLSMGGQMFSPMAGGGSSMRPQTSDGIPGSALSDFSAIPNFFYPLAPSHSTTAPSSFASASISPGNLIRQPYSTFLNTSSGSDFPLQQPIFAPPMPTSRRSSNAVLTTSSILPVPSSSNSNSSTTTPSSTPSSSSFNGAPPGTSRPSTAPSLGHRGSISNSKHSLNSNGLVVVPPRPHPHPPPHQLLPSTSETQQPLPAAFQQLLTSEPQDDTKSKVKTLIKSESSGGASSSKKDNISPVTGRPKRPRRKHEEVERLYACLAPTCGKAYGTLNHLNQHILTQNHGEKRTPAEFRDLRRAWRRKRKEQNALASAANKLAKSKAGGGKGGASTSKTNANANDGRGASTGGAGAAGPSTDKLGRRRSSATSGGLGDDDDSDSDEDYSDQDEPSVSHPQSLQQQQQQIIVPSVLSPTYPSSSSNSNSSGSHHNNPFDAPSSSSYPPNNTYQQHLSLSSSGSTSPLDPHMPFFSGPPSSTSFSPAQTYNSGTPDFNHWAFTTSSESSSLPLPPPATPGSSSYRNGAGSGLVHSSGFSPTASSGSATLVVSPQQQTGPMGRPRRIGTRRSSVNYTIEETFEV